DPLQFVEPPYALAHGATGVIAALQAVGRPVAAVHWEWTERAIINADDTARGLLDGLSGVVAVLRRAGRHRDAAAVRDRIRARSWSDLGDDL
ncbi:hypothetical protein ACXYUI_27880, partial [Klebsiella pneumoniae]